MLHVHYGQLADMLIEVTQWSRMVIAAAIETWTLITAQEHLTFGKEIKLSFEGDPDVSAYKSHGPTKHKGAGNCGPAMCPEGRELEILGDSLQCLL